MNNVITGVGVVLYNKSDMSRIVIVEEKRARANLGKESGMYGLPSGHVEENESLIEAIKREVAEETGIKEIVVKNVIGLYLIKGALGVAFSAETNDEIDLQHIDGSDIGNAKFETVDNLIKGSCKLRPGILQVVNDFNNGINFPLELIKDCR
ncbi:NUDIX hydrolase [Candidatus Woesebacteria bacterium]|nr:MAG: NUDIX hydrolase [Candidatus Woesebacteria bacterium]